MGERTVIERDVADEDGAGKAVVMEGADEDVADKDGAVVMDVADEDGAGKAVVMEGDDEDVAVVMETEDQDISIEDIFDPYTKCYESLMVLNEDISKESDDEREEILGGIRDLVAAGGDKVNLLRNLLNTYDSLTEKKKFY